MPSSRLPAWRAWMVRSRRTHARRRRRRTRQNPNTRVKRRGVAPVLAERGAADVPVGPALRGHRRARDGAVLARAHPAVDRVAHLPHDRRRAAHHGGCRAARRGLVGGGRRRRRRAGARAPPREPSRVGASASFFFPIRRVRRVLDRSAHRSLRGVAYGLRFLGLRRAGTALGLALDNASLPMIGCAVFFFTPTFLTLYGCATAALALPAAASLDALATKNHVDGTPRGTLERSRRICAQLRYWLAYSMLWSLAREPRAARSRGSRSGATSSWRSCSGWRCSGARTRSPRACSRRRRPSSPSTTRRAARARVAKEAARLERGSGSRDRSAAPGASPPPPARTSRATRSDGERPAALDGGRPADEAAGERQSRGAFADVGVSQENLRRRVNAAAGSRE